MTLSPSDTMLVLVLGVLSARSLNVFVHSEPLTSPGQSAVMSLSSQFSGSPYFTVVNKEHVDLHMDQALLKICSRVYETMTLYAQSSVCYKCPLVNITDIGAFENVTIVVDTKFSSKLQVNDTQSRSVCQPEQHFEQHGVYIMWIIHNKADTNTSDPCNIFPDPNVSPPSAFTPIYVAIGVLCGMALMWMAINCLYRRGCLHRVIGFGLTDPEQLINTDLGKPTNTDAAEQTAVTHDPEVTPRITRLRSLDTFRGLSLVIMIFVNYGGGGYWFFKHSAWNGLTVADLVFPWFVFIMGTSMALSFRGALRRGTSRLRLLSKIIRRTVILFVLGLLISNKAKNGHEVSVLTLRIPGVLQRLALTYLIVGVMAAIFTKTHDLHQHKWWAGVRDVVPFGVEWLVVSGLVALHCCLLFLLPLPHCTKGYLGPGGLQYDGQYINCTGGVTGYVDRVVLGEQHIYQHPTSKIPYQSAQPFDPEGILGIITSVVICYLGLQAGKIIVLYQDWVQRTKRWIVWSLICGLVAGVLCEFKQEGGWIPVNKNLWSLSFVLALSSMAFFTLTLCYLAVDVFSVWSGAPFIYTGMNSILIYMCHEVFHDFFPVQFHVSNTHGAQLAMDLWGTALWVTVSIVLHIKKIYIAI